MRPNSEDLDFETLTDLIYEAAVLPELWPAVLDRLARIAGGEGTILLTSDLENVRWINSGSLDATMAAFVEGKWASANTRTLKLLNADHAGFILEEDVYTPEELEGDALIRDFLRPRGLGWATATAFPVPTGDTLIFSIERRFTEGPVPRSATAILDGLRPHLGRAALLSARLKLERAKAALEALEMIGLPAAILSNRFRLQAQNQSFSHLVPRVIRDHRDRVSLTHAAADILLAQALAARSNEGSRSIPIPAEGEHPSMVIHLVPMRRGAQDVFGGGTLLMLATPAAPRPVPGTELLSGLFDLTAAEARIARGIANGITVADLAVQQRVGLGTIRTQLKAIFAKTGVTRQVDLARLVSGLSLLR